MKFFIPIFLLLPFLLFAQEHDVRGTVLDSATNEPLPYTSVLIAGTNRGTVSNLEGNFSIKLEPGNHNLVLRYVGYRIDTVNIFVPLKKKLLIKLVKQPVLLPEVLVTSEDPAYRIIREAIKRKRINRKGLENYEYGAYLKNVIESSGEIAMVQETIVKGFKLKDKKEKEFIIKTHKTENQKKKFNLNLTADLTNEHIPDFSADTLQLLMNKVYLPIADNALDYYGYKLLKIIETKNAPIYEIRVIPLSKIQPLLQGIIYIEGEHYSIVKVDLKASKGVRFPYLQNFKMEFKQSSGLYDGYRLPDYFEMKAKIGFNMGGLIGIEPMEFHEVNSITEYKINQPVPDSVLKAVKSRYGGYVSDTSKRKVPPQEISSKEMKSLRPVPLTKSEIKAFATIDTSMTLEKSIKFTGALAGFATAGTHSNKNSNGSLFGKISELLFSYVYLNNNRVEYLTLGGRYNSNIPGSRFYTNSFAAYSIGLKKSTGSISLGYRFKNFPVSMVEVEVFKKVQEWQQLNPYSHIINSASVLFGYQDYYNYYWSSGYRVGIIKYFGRNFYASINYISDKETSLKEDKYLTIINPRRILRNNPQINEGTVRKVRFSLHLGKSPLELQIIPENGLYANAELSQSFLKSDFNYEKFFIAGQIKMKTLYRELFLAPFLQINLEAGYINGSYGIQQILSPISAMGFYSPVTSFMGLKPYQFAGNKWIALHVEHNWRTIIFQALGLDFLTNLDLDIVTGAAALRIWNSSNYLPQLTQRKPYWEVYTGIARILGIIKLNVSYNSLKKFTATLSAASVF